MSSYRPLGTFPQYFLADGTVNNGGLIHFYETDLTTLKDTWSDEGLTVLNSNPVVLDSSGRPTTDIWGDGAYGVVITDSLGANPRTFNNIQTDAGSGATIPSLVTGDFLTNNGSVLQWDGVFQVPDPTGFSGDVLYTDGTLAYWASIPSAADPAITVDKTTTGINVTASDGGSDSYVLKIETGTGSSPASGGSSSSVAVSFSDSFSIAPHVVITPTTNTAASAGIPVASVVSTSTTSFSVFFNNSVETSKGGAINNPVTFAWIAVGLKS